MKSNCQNSDSSGLSVLNGKRFLESYYSKRDPEYNLLPIKNPFQKRPQRDISYLTRFYGNWDYLDEFTLDEVVALWNDLDPGIQYELEKNSGLVYPTRRKILKDIKNSSLDFSMEPGFRRKLKGDMDNLEQFQDKLLFGRRSLKEYAIKLGVKPLFLFPEERNRNLKGRKKKSLPPELKLKLDQVVRKVEISYESNSIIRVKVPGQTNPHSYDWEQLGFKSERVKTWKLLIETLEFPDDGINLGQAFVYPDGTRRNRVKNKHYDSQWKLCEDLCKKLSDFFSREFDINLPREFKLYEPFVSRGPGKFRFKFRIMKPFYIESSRIDDSLIDLDSDLNIFLNLNENDLISRVMELGKNISSDDFSSLDKNETSFINAIKAGVKNFDWSEEFVENMYLQK